MVLAINGEKVQVINSIVLKRLDDCVDVMIDDESVARFFDNGDFRFYGQQLISKYGGEWTK